jgi:hypothetical protein
MREPKPRDITMRSYLNNAIDETLIAASIADRVRMALENVPEWVKISETDKLDCVEYVASKIPKEYGAT